MYWREARVAGALVDVVEANRGILRAHALSKRWGIAEERGQIVEEENASKSDSALVEVERRSLFNSPRQKFA